MKMVSVVFLTLYDWPGRMDHKAASGKKFFLPESALCSGSCMQPKKRKIADGPGDGVFTEEVEGHNKVVQMCQDRRKQCQSGAHQCGHVTKGERVRGSPGHGAANCKTKAKAWRGPAGAWVTRRGPKSPSFATIRGSAFDGWLVCGPKVLWLRPSSSVDGALCLDWLLDPTHDLSHPDRVILGSPIEEGILHSSSIGCSTKSRAREITSEFSDGCAEAIALTPLPGRIAGVDRSG